jgi:hypothetical protein
VSASDYVKVAAAALCFARVRKIIRKRVTLAFKEEKLGFVLGDFLFGPSWLLGFCCNIIIKIINNK